MAHTKRHGPAPVPAANRPAAGPADDAARQTAAGAGGGAPLEEQDPKRRVGGFEGAGEHPRQQPSQINDGQQHSR